LFYWSVFAPDNSVEWNVLDECTHKSNYERYRFAMGLRTSLFKNSLLQKRCLKYNQVKRKVEVKEMEVQELISLFQKINLELTTFAFASNGFSEDSE
jgi:hypothetical protein